MTDQDISKMFLMVQAAYPRVFKDYTAEMIDNYIAAWCMVFADIPAEQGFAGLKAYLSTETKGFPPSPGQIMDCIHKMKPDKLPNEWEAWSLVEKAVGDGFYHADEAFSKLPQIVRRVVRNPRRLKEWGMMDAEAFQTVEQSNFMRIYRAEVEREKTVMKIPQDIRPKLEMIPDPERQMIEDKADHEKGLTPDEAIDELITALRSEVVGYGI